MAERRAPEALLDSYGQERVPVASGVLEFTDKIVGLLAMRNPLKRAGTRHRVSARHQPARGAARGRLSQLSVTYPTGPLVLTEGERDRRAGRGGPRPGERVPDVGLHAGQTRPALRAAARRPPRTGDRRRRRDRALETAGLARDGLVETAVGRIGDCAEVLIRPDGVLAARGSFPVAEYLRRLAGDLVPA